MLSNSKFRKALGIRTLACAALGFAAFSSAPAHSQVAPKDLTEGKASCLKELEERFTFVESIDGEKKITPDGLTPSYVAENCKTNLGSQVNTSHGHRENDELRGFALSQDAAGVKYAGACELSHVALKKHYEKLKDKYLEYCDYVEKTGAELTSCNGVTSKSTVSECVNSLAKAENGLKQKFESINKYLGAAKHDLEKYQNNNQEVAREFNKDRDQLGSPNPQFVASAGFENKLDDYKAALAPVARANAKSSLNEHAGALVAEQTLAQNNIEAYLKNIADFKVDKHALGDKLAEQEEKLKKLKEDMKSGGNDWKNTATTVAAAAPAAQSLMNKPGTTAASSSGAGISGAVAAIPAAVALAGAAKSASGASSAAPSLPAAAPSSHEAPTALAAAAPTSGNRNPASDNTALKTAATEAKKTEEATGSYSPMSFSADGSSRMGNLKKSQKATEENSAPAQPANYANTSADAGGGMSLNTHGGARSSTPAPGTEVTSLLGQMKSLFNFDDPSPGEGGNGGGVFGGAMPAMAPGMPGPGEPAEAGGEYAENAPADAEATGGGDPVAYEQGALPDNQADSLFVRVHKRHRRYVERGLLTANLGRAR